jgi:signal transduction histidine kinase
LSIDWSAFEDALVVEAVPLEISATSSRSRPGTTIEIRHLTTPLGRVQVRRLAKDLLLLADPFTAAENAFRPRLVSKEFEDLEKKVHDAYFVDADFRLHARLRGNGQVEAGVWDGRGRKLFEARNGIQRGSRYEAPPATFELWNYLLSPKSFAGRSTSNAEIRSWLEVVGGVHVYHRNLRVYPYGETGHDWLDMNLLRVRSPEERPSTNNSVGKVVVEDPDGLLLQKTDRSGFVENHTFQELRRFAVDTLDWMATERLRAAEKRRREEKVRSRGETERAQKRVVEIIRDLPAGTRPQFEQAYQRLESARRKEAESLRQDLLLYRTLGTVGTTIALFAHEAPRSLDQILEMARTIGDRAKKLVTESQEAQFVKPLRVITDSAQSLQSFAQLPRRLLDQSRRRSGVIDVHEAINETVEIFGSLAAGTRVEILCRLVDADPKINGTKAALDSIVSNLISNSINAFINSKSPQREARRIEINTGVTEGHVIISVLDNGPGIEGIEMDDIWLPGRTMTPRGTGLGLTIVRDTVSDLGGTVSAIAHGALGGAEFAIRLPVRE